MFYSLPVTEWGGADVSISTRLSDGRRLWLYGDTMSSQVGFVHSSAIVQDGFELRVANGGGQILPNDPPSPDGTKNIYWIETVEAMSDNRALVVAAPMALAPGGGVWGFSYRSELSRAGVVQVQPNGDVSFVEWLGHVERPDTGMDGEDFRVEGPLHYTYAEFVHDIRLADGSWLETRNQNYGDSLDDHRLPSGELRYADWRPLFSSSPTRDNPYWGH